MQKFSLADNGTATGQAKDRVGLTAGTTYFAKYWNDNFFNIFNTVEKAGYSLIDDDLEQLHKAVKGLYVATFTYNTSAIATQTVSDIVLGSDGAYYQVQSDAVIGDDPVGSATGDWALIPLDTNTVNKTGAQTIAGIKTFSSSPIAPTPTPGDNSTKVATTAFVLANAGGSVSGVRQTVQTSNVDVNGLSDYISIGIGLAVDIAATAVPVNVLASGGAVADDRLGTIDTDTSISSLTDATTNYLYADIDGAGAITLGATTLAPVYQFGGTYSIVSGQSTFNISEMTMKVGNGASADSVNRVFLGEAVTAGGVVTGVVNYALNGLFISGLSSYAASSNTSYNNNIGSQFNKSTLKFKCLTTQLGYAVGEIIEIAGSGEINGNATISIVDRNVATVTLHSNTMRFVDRGIFSYGTITPANWNKFIEVKRGW